MFVFCTGTAGAGADRVKAESVTTRTGRIHEVGVILQFILDTLLNKEVKDILSRKYTMRLSNYS